MPKHSFAVKTWLLGRQRLFFSGGSGNPAAADHAVAEVTNGSLTRGNAVLRVGKVQFGLITDKKLVPDPERIVTRFASEFDKLLMLVLMEPWARLADPEAVEANLEEA